MKQIEACGSKSLAVQADLRNPEFGAIVVQATLKGFETSGIDILGNLGILGRLFLRLLTMLPVNNAAIVDYIPFTNITDDNFATIFEANVRGPIKIVQAVLPVIRKGGRIINISSRGARVPLPGMFALYASSKAALEIITKGLATEYAADKNITINNVSPGPVLTGIHDLLNRLNPAR